MRFFALYQRQFVGTQQPFAPGSHVFAAAVEAETLEHAFEKLQGEFMDEPTLSSSVPAPRSIPA